MHVLLAALFAFASPAPDSLRVQSDSARTYFAPEVVVSATRTRISLQDSPTPINVISAPNFARSNGTTVADVLRATPSAVVGDYGSSGQLKTITLRGLSGENVLILLNGTRINSLQNGLVDLGLLPLENLERIEVVRGGSSAYYGGDALGGVVNLITRAPSDGIHGRAEASAGSFGYSRIGLMVSNGNDGAGVLAGYSRERGNDDFPFLVRRNASTDTTMTRRNSDLLRTMAYISTVGSLDAATTVDLSLQRVTAQRGIPGPLDFPSVARQDDDDVQAVLSIRRAEPGGLQLALNGGLQYSFQTYADPDTAFPISSRYRNVLITVSPEVQAVLAPWDRMLAGVEYGHGILEGSDFQTQALREQYAVFVSNEVLLERNAESFDRLSLVVAGRYHSISDVNRSSPFGDRLFFKAGFNGRILRDSDLRLRASVGTNFREPTFNDLYFVGFNNPSLKPERSSTVEGGVTAAVGGSVTHRFEITAYAIDTRDRILFDPAAMRPENIGHVVSRGLEFHYDVAVSSGTVQLIADAAFTDARKKDKSGPADPFYDRQIPYVPMSNGSLCLSIGGGDLRFNLTQAFTGRQFTTDAAAPSLPAVDRTDVNFAWTRSVNDMRIRLRLDVSNVFDADYQMYANYPMPGRSAHASVSVEF